MAYFVVEVAVCVGTGTYVHYQLGYVGFCYRSFALGYLHQVNAVGRFDAGYAVVAAVEAEVVEVFAELYGVDFTYPPDFTSVGTRISLGRELTGHFGEVTTFLQNRVDTVDAGRNGGTVIEREHDVTHFYRVWGVVFTHQPVHFIRFIFEEGSVDVTGL